MVLKKIANTASKGRPLLGVAATIAPFAISAIRKVAENPEVWTKVQEQIERLSRHRGSSPEDMLTTIEVLREQVHYLAESADDDAEAKRAEEWAKQLDQCKRAAQLLNAPGATTKQRRALKKKIGTLRADIFEAFVIEQDEDSQVED